MPGLSFKRQPKTFLGLDGFGHTETKQQSAASTLEIYNRLVIALPI